MAVFNEPQKWAQTLGQDADVTIIPDTSGETEPSIDKIFPAVFSIPLAQGGKAIPRSVLNGLFKLLGDWCYYAQNGGIASYTNTFDYKIGAFVKYNNEFYRCIQANGASTEVKAPTETAYWSKITTLADVANAFANQDLSNLSASGQTIIDNKADISFSNVNNTANILMAHNAMPSDKYDDLTLGATGTAYTAPADGFFYLDKIATASGQLVHATCYDLANQELFHAFSYSFANNNSLAVFVPIKKGNSVRMWYNAQGSTNYFRFIYAVGSESEQQEIRQ